MTQNPQQRSFLDPGYQPPVRRFDPPTSQAAAEAIKPKLAGLRQIAYERAVTLCAAHGDATANEIGYFDPSDPPLRCESLRKRCRELVDLGFLIEVAPRICRQSGSKVTAYKIRR